MLPFGLAAAAIPKILEIVGGFIGDKDKLNELEVKLRSDNVQADLQRDLSSMELRLGAQKSEDPFVRRARPLFLYLIYVFFAVFFFAACLGAFLPERFLIFAGNIKAMFAAIPDQGWMFFSAVYLGYTGGRSWDKQTKMKNGGR